MGFSEARTMSFGFASLAQCMGHHKYLINVVEWMVISVIYGLEKHVSI
jgi:hypothetical protein